MDLPEVASLLMNEAKTLSKNEFTGQTLNFENRWRR